MGRGWICGSAIDPCHLRRSGHRKHDPVTGRSVGLDSVTDCCKRSYGREVSIQARCSEASVGCCGASVDRFEGRNRRLVASKGRVEASIRRFQPSEGRGEASRGRLDPSKCLTPASKQPTRASERPTFCAPLDLAFDSLAAHRWRHHNHDICLGEVGQGRSRLALERPLSH